MTESQLLVNACNIIADYIKDEFIKQGHSLTEAWENSVIVQEGSDNSAEIWATGYGMIVDAGITPERIPYGGQGTGGDGTLSKYILGLQRFWLLRKPGITDKQALKLAFATAEVQKQEGMSTIASEGYSATGNRQHFMQAIDTLFKESLDDWIFTGLDVIVNEQADEPKVLYL